MATFIDIESSQGSLVSEIETFKKDVLLGLTNKHKYLNAKYFYDKKGSEIFNEITKLPEYYLTNSEIEILTHYKKNLADLMKAEKSFNLIELGPGEGIKTQILIKEFLNRSLNFRYVPIDISQGYLVSLENKFKHENPNLSVAPIHADYFKGIAWQSKHSHRKNLVLFLGSSIGNFNPDETQIFLQNLKSALRKDDYFLIGIDLKKDIKILLNAYDDSAGVTREFNLNLLKRINRELSGEFSINKFTHYATYNINIDAMESYLVSNEAQHVNINTLNKSVNFSKIEPIHMESSYKYDMAQIEKLAKTTGFSVVQNFIDKKEYFMNSLWKVE